VKKRQIMEIPSSIEASLFFYKPSANSFYVRAAVSTYMDSPLQDFGRTTVAEGIEDSAVTPKAETVSIDSRFFTGNHVRQYFA
jgi:hypothetical protein